MPEIEACCPHRNIEYGKYGNFIVAAILIEYVYLEVCAKQSHAVQPLRLDIKVSSSPYNLRHEDIMAERIL